MQQVEYSQLGFLTKIELKLYMILHICSYPNLLLKTYAKNLRKNHIRKFYLIFCTFFIRKLV